MIDTVKIIKTKFYPCTATKPRKIIATGGADDRLSRSIDMDDCNMDGSHLLTARALMEQLGWTGELIGGYHGDGMYWAVITLAFYTRHVSREPYAPETDPDALPCLSEACDRVACNECTDVDGNCCDCPCHHKS